jgi:hypothetical protein
VRGILQVSGDSLNLDLVRLLSKPYGAEVTRTLEILLQELR